MEIEKGGGRPSNARGYRLADGTRVPSVTTILGRWKESGPLIQWAWSEGAAGRELYAKRDEAADIGSVVHDAVEAHVHAVDGAGVIATAKLDAEGRDRAVCAYEAYLHWEQACRVEYRATEVPLVSERYRFGGTLDCVARVGGDDEAILDWKSSRGIYGDMLLQLAGYALLWEENRHRPIDVAHICRFSKSSGAFEHRRWPELKLAKEQFIALVDCYRRDRALKECL